MFRLLINNIVFLNKFYIKHNNINSFKSPSTINKNNNNNKKNKISTLTTTTLLIAAISLALVLVGSIIGNLLLVYAQPQQLQQPQQQGQQQQQQPLPPQAQIPVEKIQSKLRERFGCELCDDRDLFMKLQIQDIRNMNRTELEFNRDWLSDVISDINEENISDQKRIEQRNALLERLTEFDRILGSNR